MDSTLITTAVAATACERARWSAAMMDVVSRLHHISLVLQRQQSATDDVAYKAELGLQSDAYIHAMAMLQAAVTEAEAGDP